MIYREYAAQDINLPIVLLDRDGTLNKDSKGYTKNISDLELTNFALRLKALGDIYRFQMVIISNQSGIGRGLYSLEQFFSFTESLLPLIQGEYSFVQMVVACPHTPELNCSCRKPAPAMLNFAINGSHKSNVCFIGDSDADKLAAYNSSIEFFDVNIQADENLNLWLEERL